ncbi:MAG: hypothetical protein JNM27_03120 [Leptospirales bacterium]|nr:hypothetical protein [Leptospirales bacterium]
MTQLYREERLTWQTIDYSPAVPDSFLVPEHHWPGIRNESLPMPVRIRLNHFASYFMCEMFIHFEQSIIDYMLIHKKDILQYISEVQLGRFVREERDHIAAFETLARKIRPDLYVDRPRFLVPTLLDRVVLNRTPLACFFMMAALFEEMTLYVYPVMLENLEESWGPYLDVMRLHALEERGHIGLDRIIVDGRLASHGRIRTRAGMLWLLPLVAYSDRRIVSAWRKGVEYFARTEQLTSAQESFISSKGLSRSDVDGMRSFVKKNLEKPVPGNGLLCFALSRMTG